MDAFVELFDLKDASYMSQAYSIQFDAIQFRDSTQSKFTSCHNHNTIKYKLAEIMSTHYSIYSTHINHALSERVVVAVAVLVIVVFLLVLLLGVVACSFFFVSQGPALANRPSDHPSD